MKHVETKYYVTLKSPEGYVINKVPARFNGTFMVGQRLWAVYTPSSYYNHEYCNLEFFEKNISDEEMFKGYYYKVLSMKRVDVYQEEEPIYEAD